MNFIEIQNDADNVQKRLSVLSKSIKSIQKGFLGVIGKNAKNEINNSTKAIKGNGYINNKFPYSVAKSYISHVSKDGEKLAVYPKAIEPGRKNDLTIPVFSTLNYGKTITTRGNKPYLTIHLKSGEWRKCKSVQITGLHFVEKGFNYIHSEKYKSDVEKYIEKELKKAGL